MYVCRPNVTPFRDEGDANPHFSIAGSLNPAFLAPLKDEDKQRFRRAMDLLGLGKVSMVEGTYLCNFDSGWEPAVKARSWQRELLPSNQDAGDGETPDIL